ncbi:MAG TPA: hypothetical protein V6C52_02995 [Coleofasciculaceae cyanobacterium]
MPNPETGQMETRKVFLSAPFAKLPVLVEDELQLVQWGKREGEAEV